MHEISLQKFQIISCATIFSYMKFLQNDSKYFKIIFKVQQNHTKTGNKLIVLFSYTLIGNVKIRRPITLENTKPQIYYTMLVQLLGVQTQCQFHAFLLVRNKDQNQSELSIPNDKLLLVRIQPNFQVIFLVNCL